MAFYSSLSDVDLLSLFKEGDDHAYAELYTRYWSVIYIYACKMLDKDEAEDIVQEVFTYFWKNGPKLVLKNSVASYLYSATRYRIFDYFDYKKVRTNYQDSLQHFIDQGEYVTDNLIREKELARLVEAELNLLPVKMREVFELSRKANLSNKEIAERLHISDKTVKKQIGNAIKVLKLKLSALISLLLFLSYL